VFPVNSAPERIAVLVVAVAVLIGFLFWSRRATSHPFFLGVPVGTGLVLSFDIVWVHTGSSDCTTSPTIKRT